ncbi:hypothetical protein DL93DRAFT_2078956 [Clavulina sp. PMI_390]|nr:hypothetical protein DL93DRAFT_2078956 [Clavulina sp. PMI_390]
MSEANALSNGSIVLTLSSPSWRYNTIYGPDMKPLYIIEEVSSSGAVVIYRQLPSTSAAPEGSPVVEGDSKQIAVLNFGSSLVTTEGGANRMIDDVFFKSGTFASTRTMATSLGTCTWSIQMEIPELTLAGKPIIAYSPDSNPLQPDAPSSPPTLLIAQQAATSEVMDLIIAGFVVTMHDLEQRKQQKSYGRAKEHVRTRSAENAQAIMGTSQA